MQGRLLGVLTIQIGDGGIVEELWAAAIDDDDQAIEAVKAAEAATPDQKVVVRTQLSQAALTGLGLSAGEVRRVVVG